MTTTSDAIQAWERQMAVVIAAYQNDYERAKVTLAPTGVTLDAVVVASRMGKADGMMGRIFDEFDAMLFVEQEDTLTGFHNRNVSIPLLVAFFDADGVLVDQFRLDENDPTVRRPKVPFRYALELPAEWNDLAPQTTLIFE